MFGHLRADELMNLIETGSFPEKARTHLSTCMACQAKLRSVESAYRDITVVDENNDSVPEPNWNAFRDSVRLSLLSRSVKRESTVRRWTGWSIRPAMAWSLSLFFAVCLGTGGFLWHVSQDRNRAIPLEVQDGGDSATNAVDGSAAVSTESADVEAEIAMWTSPRVFEEAGKLQAAQAQELRKLLESARKGSIEQQ